MTALPSRLATNPILKTSASDLLRDLDLTDDELQYLLELADEVKRWPGDFAQALVGKSIACSACGAVMIRNAGPAISLRPWRESRLHCCLKSRHCARA